MNLISHFFQTIWALILDECFPTLFDPNVLPASRHCFSIMPSCNAVSSIEVLSSILFVLCSAHLAWSTQAGSAGQEVFGDGQSENYARAATGLNFSSASPHIFSSLCYLLQQWPNTFFPNGHSIVPCEVPAYTNLYHGRRDDQIPPGPEWFAFDIEMSYGIMGSMRDSHMLTVRSNCEMC